MQIYMSVTKKILVTAISVTVLLILLSIVFGFYFISPKLSPASGEMVVQEDIKQEVSEPQEVEVTDAYREQIMIDLESNLAQEVELEPDDAGNYSEATEADVQDSDTQAIMADMEDDEQEVIEEDDPSDSNDSSATSGQNTQEEESSGEMSREERESIMADMESGQEQVVEPE
jgi:hypothetical protein